MKPQTGRWLAVSGLLLAGLLALGWAVAREGVGRVADTAGGSPPAATGRPLQPDQKVIFLELGSVGCRACEAMVPVLEAVRQRFPDRVEVVFHDVKKDPAVAGRHGIRLIPTQIFLRTDGSEFFRHEGYFPEADVVAVLERMGVR